ncbi:hypothetical protein L2E82_11046 [Cichorium intybus]|uniref:Uncharacterized protein n=1 Tax=Cichorium intybus TaxID=13427 RepID=A0ACB9GE81_CICIN|nr:hypothetical protein L2E82_11046 [Cichorium intybus]
MFGEIKESGLDYIDLEEKSYEFSFSNPSDSSSSYLNSYFEDESDVKPLGTSILGYPLTETFFDNQTPETLLSQAFDLKDSEFFIQQKLEDYKGSHEFVLEEIREVLKAVCDANCLPLAQTWSLCSQQGRHECRNKSTACISVVPSASYLFDPNVLGFYEACHGVHLLRGEGIAGKALSTNQPCFATDVTAFSATEYPLSAAARAFGLGGAVAIRLRSTYLGPIDFILEFFLPNDCRNDEEQKNMLSSISSVIQNVSRSLRVINDDELVEEDESSSTAWISRAQKRGESFILSFKEEPQEEFKVINQWDYTKEQKSKPKGKKRSFGIRKMEEKRRVKPEKNISLPVLQQYFPGSLKDAAKNIGVCPTTLKRICREHGIMRWPSRKIKKVGHSLKKLQTIIDSVQGADGTIKLGTFYKNFPELSSRPTTDYGNLRSHSSSCGSPNERKSKVRSKREKLLDCDDSNEGVFRVKVVYGEEKIRLSVLKDCGFGDLRREVMRRFGMDDVNSVTLKYLDDDLEWVLLTCDADLEECMDINVASRRCTIKVLVHESFHPESGSSFTGNGLSY